MTYDLHLDQARGIIIITILSISLLSSLSSPSFFIITIVVIVNIVIIICIIIIIVVNIIIIIIILLSLSLSTIIPMVMVITLRPRRNEQQFADDILKPIFFNENVWISIQISLKFVPKGPINNIPALVQIMAWRRSGDKPLSEPMMVSLPTHICVTRPQWVIPSVCLGVDKFMMQ